MTKISICFSSDNNYAQHLCVTLASVLVNKLPSDEIVVYVLDGGISQYNKSKILDLQTKFDFEINFIAIDKNLHDKFPQGKKNHVTLATYYRLLLPELCPCVDKLLYLDVDIIVNSSLSELFNIELGKYYFAGVKDSEELINAERLNLQKYCNAGVLLINLKKWREDDVTHKFFAWMHENQNKILLHDQDVINCVLQDAILVLDNIWNVQVSKYQTSKEFVMILPDAKIIHYIGKHKPWHTNFKQIAKKQYFDCLKLTPWKWFVINYYVVLVLKLPILLLDKVFHFILSTEKQNGIKYLVIFGFKINIR